MFITSTDVVLLDTREACMTTKQRRLSAKAKFRTASRYTICKEHRNNEKAETKAWRWKKVKKKKSINLGGTLTKSQKSDCKISRRARMILRFTKELDKTRQQN